MTWLVDFVLGRRALVVGVLVALTGVAAWSASRAVVATSMESLFFGDSPAYAEYLERVEEFGTEEVNLVAYPAANPLAPESQLRIRGVVERLEALPDVRRVITALDAQRVYGDGDVLRVDTYADLALAEPERADALLEELRVDPLAGGLVLAREGPYAAALIELTADPHRPAEAGPVILDAVLEAFASEGYAAEELHQAGLLVTSNAMVQETRYSFETIFPAVALVLLFTVWLLFRRLWPALVSLGVSLVGVLWTVGFMVMLDPEVNVTIAIVPIVILVVGFSDVVHLCSAYLIELEHGHDKDSAIRRAAVDVGRACLFTSATTFVGFVCLALTPTPTFQRLGVALGFGVAMALLIAVTFVPILFSWLPQPKALRGGATDAAQRGVDGLLAACHRLAARRPRLIVGVFGGVTAVSLVLALQLDVEADFDDRLEADNPVVRDLTWLGEHFEGSIGLDLFVDAGAPGALLEPATFARIDALQQRLLEDPRIDSAISLVDLMRTLYAAYSPERAAEQPYPSSRAGLAQLLSLFESGASDNQGMSLGSFVDFNRQRMRIMLRLEDGEVRTSSAVGRDAEAVAAEVLGSAGEGAAAAPSTPPPTSMASGLYYLLGDWLDVIVGAQRRGLALSFVTIALLMVLAVRSVRVALWSMIPNLLPLLVLGAYLFAAYDRADSDTLIVALLALGIGVDDTIHVLVRLRTEAARTATATEALKRTFDFAGRGVVMTTVILVAGFLPFMTSDYFSTQILGTLLPMCLVVALVADLLFVPALVHVGALRWKGVHSW